MVHEAHTSEVTHPNVSVEDVAPRRLAVAAATISSHGEISSTIRRLLDAVWPVLRSQGEHLTTGHNVVIYRPSANTGLSLEAGVEISGDFTPTDVVYESATPAGRVARVAHIGPYSQMQTAYAALDEWARAHGEPRAQLSWELYGDWTEDPNALRTDIFYKLSSQD